MMGGRPLEEDHWRNTTCIQVEGNIKLHFDLFNMLMCSTASYAYKVWVDFKKIKAIEIMYQGFFKSLLGVRRTTSMSIVLTEFGKFPFEHFDGDKRCFTITM